METGNAISDIKIYTVEEQTSTDNPPKTNDLPDDDHSDDHSDNHSDNQSDNQSEDRTDDSDIECSVECMTLCISQNCMETSILRAVLAYLDSPFEVCLGDMNDDIVLRVPENFKNGNNAMDITGFNAIFITLTRLTHLFPSDAFNAGIVMQYLEFSKRATLNEIEVHLKENQERWFVPSFLESTAVDFFLINKLTFERSVNGCDYKDYPYITKYLENDPALQTADSGDEPEPSSRFSTYCTIS